MTTKAGGGRRTVAHGDRGATSERRARWLCRQARGGGGSGGCATDCQRSPVTASINGATAADGTTVVGRTVMAGMMHAAEEQPTGIVGQHGACSCLGALLGVVGMEWPVCDICGVIT